MKVYDFSNWSDKAIEVAIKFWGYGHPLTSALIREELKRLFAECDAFFAKCGIA